MGQLGRAGSGLRGRLLVVPVDNPLQVGSLEILKDHFIAVSAGQTRRVNWVRVRFSWGSVRTYPSLAAEPGQPGQRKDSKQRVRSFHQFL